MSLDQRLIELRLLGWMAREGGYVQLRHNLHEALGTTGPLLKDLVLSLIVEGFVTGAEPGVVGPIRADGNAADPRTYLWRTNEPTVLALLTDRHPLMVRVTHQGLMRLARLRDEMDRDRLRDQTGILLDGRNLEKDLRVRLAVLRQGEILAVLSADLDNFKQVNSRLQYSVGTEVLKRYFTLLRDLSASEGADAYREGGDETITLLVGTEDQRAKHFAEAIRRGVEEEMGFLADRGIENPVTVSIGVLLIRGPTAAEELVKEADRLRDEAKKQGKNRVVLEEMSRSSPIPPLG